MIPVDITFPGHICKNSNRKRTRDLKSFILLISMRLISQILYLNETSVENGLLGLLIASKQFECVSDTLFTGFQVRTLIFILSSSLLAVSSP